MSKKKRESEREFFFFFGGHATGGGHMASYAPKLPKQSERFPVCFPTLAEREKGEKKKPREVKRTRGREILQRVI